MIFDPPRISTKPNGAGVQTCANRPVFPHYHPYLRYKFLQRESFFFQPLHFHQRRFLMSERAGLGLSVCWSRGARGGCKMMARMRLLVKIRIDCRCKCIRVTCKVVNSMKRVEICTIWPCFKNFEFRPYFAFIFPPLFHSKRLLQQPQLRSFS